MSKSSLASITRKVLMALSGMFLMIFLIQHLTINGTSVFSPEMFNELSHFMGTNFLVQAILQPVLMAGVLLHFILGFILEARNRAARQVKYAKNDGAANSSWMSRNMIITGIVVLLFLGLHLYDFWIHEMQVKYFQGDMSGLNEAGELRYYEELTAKFVDPVRVGIYVLSFVFLALHLMHGFQSSFQSIGANHPKYTPWIKTIGKAYAILIPLGFVFIAVFHFINA